MLLTIITVAFNSVETIRDTMESVLNQKCKDYEYVVVDGASKDGTLEVIKEFLPRFNGRMRYVSEPDTGIYDAMNKGIRMAQGDVIGILNSDDFFADENVVGRLLESFEKNPQSDAVYANLYYVSQKKTDNIVRRWVTGHQKPFAKGWLPAHPTFYVKKTIYERCGLFNLDYRLAADFELMLRFVERYHIKLTYLPEFLVKMRLGGATNNSISNIIEQDKECVRAFKENQVPVSRLYLLYRYLPKIKQYL